MELTEFEKLHYCEKDELVWKYGKFIISYNEDDDLYDVYELFEFYVAYAYKVSQSSGAVILVTDFPDALPHLARIKRIG